jgi:hypothetical protein
MPISIDGKNAIMIGEYNGVVQLTLGYLNKDGVFKASWCRFGYEAKEGEKPQPFRIILGDKGTAPSVVQEMLKETIIICEGREPDDGAPF